MPERPPGDPTIGTLITLAPAACPLGHLLRAAIDAEQVGASRIHLATDQPDFVATFQRSGDRVENGVNGLPGLCLGDLRLVGDYADEIVLVHWVSSR